MAVSCLVVAGGGAGPRMTRRELRQRSSKAKERPLVEVWWAFMTVVASCWSGGWSSNEEEAEGNGTRVRCCSAA
ncbi:hypothetical protein TRIUR3_30683 [Triticum urartu]|uniref:Uncharacterized protein n=1 Tax=Triticum urartu TaxID=4572 RepID=M7ZF37_TRIUA|nr:hypothetical protein TRIUR3_30683 [Triticum urartu]